MAESKSALQKAGVSFGFNTARLGPSPEKRRLKRAPSVLGDGDMKAMIQKRRAEAKFFRKMQTASKAALGLGKLSAEEVAMAKKITFTRNLAVPLLVVPAVLLMLYSALVLLPGDSVWLGSPGLLFWTLDPPLNVPHINGTVVSHVGGNNPKLCPRDSICSEGPLEISLIAIARLSAYTLYPALALAFLTKCYCTLHWLRTTPISLYFPLQWIHSLHRVSGMMFMLGSIVHTVAHLVRWAVRGGGAEIHRQLSSRTGLSGVGALTFLFAAVLPMYLKQCTKWIEQPHKWRPSFEMRHWLHLMVVPMLIILLWHQGNVTIVCAVLLCIYGLDRGYLILFKTYRVEDVTFMRLQDGTVQMQWQNPRNQARPRPGEYMRVMVPAINNEFHPFSVFDYMPDLDMQLQGTDAKGKKKKRRASEFKAESVIDAAVMSFLETERGNELKMRGSETPATLNESNSRDRSNPATPMLVRPPSSTNSLASTHASKVLQVPSAALTFSNLQVWSTPSLSTSTITTKPEEVPSSPNGSAGLERSTPKPTSPSSIAHVNKHEPSDTERDVSDAPSASQLRADGDVAEAVPSDTERDVSDTEPDVSDTETDVSHIESDAKHELRNKELDGESAVDSEATEATEAIANAPEAAVHPVDEKDACIAALSWLRDKEVSIVTPIVGAEETSQVLDDFDDQSSFASESPSMLDVNDDPEMGLLKKEVRNISDTLRITPSYSQVFISPSGDWTKQLSAYVMQMSNAVANSWVAPCWVQGPFTSPFNAGVGYGRLILVASGIGLSAALPLVQQLRENGREVFMVWITRSVEQIAYLLPMLLNCTYAMVYYTGKDTISPKVVKSFHHFRHCVLYQGRPDMPVLINWLVHSQHAQLAKDLNDKSNADKQEAIKAAKMAAMARKIAEEASRKVDEAMKQAVEWEAAAAFHNRSSHGGTACTPDSPAVPTVDAFTLRQLSRSVSKLVVPSQQDEAPSTPHGASTDDPESNLAPPVGPPDDLKELHDATILVTELRKHMPRRDRDAWCVLYCGGVKKVQDELRASCSAWRFHYSEESFAW
jgi:hypothetical protein